MNYCSRDFLFLEKILLLYVNKDNSAIKAIIIKINLGNDI